MEVFRKMVYEYHAKVNEKVIVNDKPLITQIKEEVSNIPALLASAYGKKKDAAVRTKTSLVRLILPLLEFVERVTLSV